MASPVTQRPMVGPLTSFPELSNGQLEAVVRDGSADAAGRLLSELLDAVCVVAEVSALNLDNIRLFETLRRRDELQSAVLGTHASLGEGLGIVDLKEQRFVYVDDLLSQIYGYSPEELIAMPSYYDVLAPGERDRL